MPRLRILITGLLLVSLAFGCSDDDGQVDPTSSGAAAFSNGASLFGLVDDRTLIYVRTDTTWEPDFSFATSTRRDTISISGGDGDWVVKNATVPVLNLKVTDGWVIQNGYWRRIEGMDIIADIDPPPVLMTPGLEVGDSWQGHFPPFPGGLDDGEPFFYYSYFGFLYTREYLGRELLHVPGGSFNAYCFDVSLFWNSSDSVAAATAREYYVPAVGLVKLHFVGGPLKRTLSLISYQ